MNLLILVEIIRILMIMIRIFWFVHFPPEIILNVEQAETNF